MRPKILHLSSTKRRSWQTYVKFRDQGLESSLITADDQIFDSTGCSEDYAPEMIVSIPEIYRQYLARCESRGMSIQGESRGMWFFPSGRDIFHDITQVVINDGDLIFDVKRGWTIQEILISCPKAIVFLIPALHEQDLANLGNWIEKLNQDRPSNQRIRIHVRPGGLQKQYLFTLTSREYEDLRRTYPQVHPYLRSNKYFYEIFFDEDGRLLNPESFQSYMESAILVGSHGGLCEGTSLLRYVIQKIRSEFGDQRPESRRNGPNGQHKGQILIYCFNRKGCRDTALNLAQVNRRSPLQSGFRNKILNPRDLERFVRVTRGLELPEKLLECLSQGVAWIWSDMDYRIICAIDELFRSGKLEIVLATETYNSPAQTIVFTSFLKIDENEDRVPLTPALYARLSCNGDHIVHLPAMTPWSVTLSHRYVINYYRTLLTDWHPESPRLFNLNARIVLEHDLDHVLHLARASLFFFDQSSQIDRDRMEESIKEEYLNHRGLLLEQGLLEHLSEANGAIVLSKLGQAALEIGHPLDLVKSVLTLAGVSRDNLDDQIQDLLPSFRVGSSKIRYRNQMRNIETELKRAWDIIHG